MGSHWISAPAQVRSLAKAVSAAFSASVLTPEEISPGRIEITDLAWQAPPLLAEGLLMGGELADYLDVPLLIEAEHLHRFWTKTLYDMWHTPSRLLRRGTHNNCGVAMPKVRAGQRALRFSRPAGYPSLLDEQAGAMFSLEVAHAARCSLPVRDFVADADNYYVRMEDGMLFGIKDGLPACDSNWRTSVAGFVPEMLTMPRGEPDYTPRFDQIAALRSVLHVHRKRFPKNFDAIEAALQALRLLTLGGHCPDLTTHLYVAPQETAIFRAQEMALRDAIELMPDPMSDRSKLQVLHSLLVPSVIPASSFKKYIFSNPHYPFTLAQGKLEMIDAWLRRYYETKIPAELRKLKG